MSVTSVGATSLFSIWTMVKPPTLYREPPLLKRFMELLSCGNSVKGSHLRTHSNSIVADQLDEGTVEEPKLCDSGDIGAIVC